jgi:hypothetical protein
MVETLFALWRQIVQSLHSECERSQDFPSRHSLARSGQSYGASSPIMIWPHPQRIDGWAALKLCALGGSCQWLLGEHHKEGLFREAGCWVAGLLSCWVSLPKLGATLIVL